MLKWITSSLILISHNLSKTKATGIKDMDRRGMRKERRDHREITDREETLKAKGNSTNNNNSSSRINQTKWIKTNNLVVVINNHKWTPSINLRQVLVVIDNNLPEKIREDNSERFDNHNQNYFTFPNILTILLLIFIIYLKMSNRN